MDASVGDHVRSAGHAAATVSPALANAQLIERIPGLPVTGLKYQSHMSLDLWSAL
jgi:hypothetical protein